MFDLELSDWPELHAFLRAQSWDNCEVEIPASARESVREDPMYCKLVFTHESSRETFPVMHRALAEKFANTDFRISYIPPEQAIENWGECAGCDEPHAGPGLLCQCCSNEYAQDQEDLTGFLFEAVKALGAKNAELGLRHAELQLEHARALAELAELRAAAEDRHHWLMDEVLRGK